MTWRIFVVSIVMMISSISGAYAEKAGFCVTTKDAMSAIKNAGEVIVFRGLSKRGHLVTIYLSKKSQTFTALVHYQDGRSCFVDFGTSGEVLPTDGDPA